MLLVVVAVVLLCVITLCYLCRESLSSLNEPPAPSYWTFLRLAAPISTFVVAGFYFVVWYEGHFFGAKLEKYRGKTHLDQYHPAEG